MQPLNVFSFEHTKSVQTFKLGVEFKLNWVNWEAEVEVTRTDEENNIDHEFKILNKEQLPEMTTSEERDLNQFIEDYIQTLIEERKI